MSSTIYLDTCIAIDLVEEHPLCGPVVENALSRVSAVICHSALVELESLVLPIRQGQEGLIRRFRRFFAASRRLSMADSVFILAAELRARHGLKTPDALHLAAAMYHGCDTLWTNDNRLAAAVPGLAVNVLEM
ncbi:MAG: type II toxin-antitoxin system VapC family toxin [Magnetococcales bacterium]|nr:type II toxin-antitoxin system VapC family toxin [Magnetococcales bacterium]